MRRLAANLLLVFVAIVAAASLVEAGLRLAGLSYPRFYQPDPVRGASHRPGAEGWYRREGEAWISISSAGLRDREHERAKPVDSFRIAFLGDSYTEALQVALDDTYWAVTERELNGCAALRGRRVEALNFGVSGYGTDQALQTLRSVVWDYEPDLVVLGFLTGNDVRNNLRELQRTVLKPYFVLQDGRLVLDDSFLRSPEWARTQGVWWRAKDLVARHLRLVQFALEFQAIRGRGGESTGRPGSDDPVYEDRPDRDWQLAWEITERLIATMRDEVEAHGARFQLLVLTNAEQVHPDLGVRAEKARQLGVEDLLYPDRRVAQFARRQGIEVLTLVEAFQSEAIDRGICLHGFENAVPCGGHWNAAGHRLAGELLGRHVCLGLTSPRDHGTPSRSSSTLHSELPGPPAMVRRESP
jgi:hypothetical protein